MPKFTKRLIDATEAIGKHKFLRDEGLAGCG